MKRGRSENNRAKGGGDHNSVGSNGGNDGDNGNGNHKRNCLDKGSFCDHQTIQRRSRTTLRYRVKNLRPFTSSTRYIKIDREDLKVANQIFYEARSQRYIYDRGMDPNRFQHLWNAAIKRDPTSALRLVDAFMKTNPDPIYRSNAYKCEDFLVGSSNELLKMMKRDNTHEDGRVRSLFLPRGLHLHHLPGEAPRLDAAAILVLDSVRNIGNISSWIKNMPNLNTLFLFNQPDLPQEAGNLMKLRKLHIQNWTQVSDPLPPYIWQMTNLTTLQLSIKIGGSLPDSIGDLIHLEHLSLGRSDFSRICSIGKLTKLKSLDLSKTRALQRLPDSIGNLIRLEHLSVRGSHLSYIPPSIGKLKKLKLFDLSRTKALQSLPDELGELVCLEVLNLEFSSIESVPSSTRNLENLKCLQLSGENAISSLGQEIHGLISLKKLNMTKLPSILPPWIGNFKNIQILPSILPPWIGNFKNIQILKICVDSLLSLPEQLGNLVTLEHLSISDTNIVSLPTSIKRLKNLKQLVLCNNTKLKSLSEGIKRLKQLVDINLEGQNLIVGLPWLIRHFLENCSSLVALNVQKCGLSEIKPISVVPEKLQIFNVYNNPIVDSGEGSLPNKHLSDLVMRSTVLGSLAKNDKDLKYCNLVDKMRLNRAMTRVVSCINGNQRNGAVSLALWAPILFRARASFGRWREPFPGIFGDGYFGDGSESLRPGKQHGYCNCGYDSIEPRDGCDYCERDLPNEEDAIFILIKECFVKHVDCYWNRSRNKMDSSRSLYWLDSKPEVIGGQASLKN